MEYIIREMREKEYYLLSDFLYETWETGETQPNTDTLKLLSKEFGVSINTLLGAPSQLVCQCCGMPLSEDTLISRESDGSYNEDYCKWCYADGKFAYQSKESLLDYLVEYMPCCLHNDCKAFTE